jgi:hypothetical protein
VVVFEPYDCGLFGFAVRGGDSAVAAKRRLYRFSISVRRGFLASLYVWIRRCVVVAIQRNLEVSIRPKLVRGRVIRGKKA